MTEPEHQAPGLKQILEMLDEVNRKLDMVIMAPQPKWVTLSEYSRKVNRSIRTIERWINEGKVETKLSGNVKLIKVGS